MAPRVLIFLIAMGADYSFELNSIDTEAPTMGQLQDNFRNSFIDSFRDNSVDNFLPMNWRLGCLSIWDSLVGVLRRY